MVGALGGAVLVLILMLAVSVFAPSAVGPVLFFGLLILPLLGAGLAVKLPPGRKERIWTHKR